MSLPLEVPLKMPAGTPLGLFLTMYLRALRETRRIVLAVASVPLLVPIFMVIVFGPAFANILQATGLSGASSYVQYIAPGAILTAVMLPATAAVSVTIERQTGFYDRMRLSPMGPRLSNLARRAADTTKLVGFATVLVLVSWLAGAEVGSWPLVILLGIGLSALWGFAYSGLSFAVCLRSGRAEFAEAILPAFYPLLLVSSAYVPLSQLPEWMRTLATYNPLTYLADTIRGAYIGHMETRSLMIALASTLALIAIGQFLTARAERAVATRG